MYAHQYAAKNEDKKTAIFIFKVQCGSFLFQKKPILSQVKSMLRAVDLLQQIVYL